MSPSSDEETAIAYLRSALAIRARCENILDAGLAGKLTHFAINLDALPAVVEEVVATTRAEVARLVLKGATPSMQDVATACGLGVRALREQLAQEGASFRRLLDDVRRDLAREHLARGFSVTETSYLLGFSEPAAFQHACKRWFGHAAGELRSQN